MDGADAPAFDPHAADAGATSSPEPALPPVDPGDEGFSPGDEASGMSASADGAPYSAIAPDPTAPIGSEDYASTAAPPPVDIDAGGFSPGGDAPMTGNSDGAPYNANAPHEMDAGPSVGAAPTPGSADAAPMTGDADGAPYSGYGSAPSQTASDLPPSTASDPNDFNPTPPPEVANDPALSEAWSSIVSGYNDADHGLRDPSRSDDPAYAAGQKLRADAVAQEYVDEQMAASYGSISSDDGNGTPVSSDYYIGQALVEAIGELVERGHPHGHEPEYHGPPEDPEIPIVE